MKRIAFGGFVLLLTVALVSCEYSSHLPEGIRAVRDTTSLRSALSPYAKVGDSLATAVQRMRDAGFDCQSVTGDKSTSEVMCSAQIFTQKTFAWHVLLVGERDLLVSVGVSRSQPE
jgi:hypothetical protein